ncbi:hypothetical protein [uncultured Nitratireductor sp.]|uniref:hypothetical protein n=1 Tax=uncultured Nitratireductor sp. TaxID=520953 RepID=UPI0025EEBCE2|nr:hypothetical protein [uncultured Nitratireductor sp.]
MLERCVRVGSVDRKPDNVGKTRSRRAQNGVQIVQRERDPVTHIIQVLRIDGGSFHARYLIFNKKDLL